jgi:citrate synthase
VSRQLYPNGFLFGNNRALGIPTDMFTVMFAIGRLPGWIAQWKEMRENKRTNREDRDKLRTSR